MTSSSGPTLRPRSASSTAAVPLAQRMTPAMSRSARSRGSTLAIVAAVVGSVIGVSSGTEETGLDPAKVLADTPILFTTRAADRDGTHSYMRPTSFSQMGGALKVLDPASGRTRTLVTSPDGIIRRPCVHFDGNKVLFERTVKHEPFELDVDIQGVKRLVIELQLISGMGILDHVHLCDARLTK